MKVFRALLSLKVNTLKHNEISAFHNFSDFKESKVEIGKYND